MGEKITLSAKDKCFVLIAAPGNPLNVHEQNPPTDLTIFLNKAKFKCPVPIINNKKKSLTDYNGKKLMIVSARLFERDLL